MRNGNPERGVPVFSRRDDGDGKAVGEYIAWYNGTRIRYQKSMKKWMPLWLASRQASADIHVERRYDGFNSVQQIGYTSSRPILFYIRLDRVMDKGLLFRLINNSKGGTEERSLNRDFLARVIYQFNQIDRFFP